MAELAVQVIREVERRRALRQRNHARLRRERVDVIVVESRIAQMAPWAPRRRAVLRIEIGAIARIAFVAAYVTLATLATLIAAAVAASGLRPRPFAMLALG